MSTNIRGDRVVEPLHTAEFDRIAKSSPIALLVGGVLVFAGSVVTVIALGGENVVVPLVVFAGVGAMVLAFWHSYKLGEANIARLTEMSRPLEPLFGVASFDPATLSSDALWEAAGLALHLAEFEETYAPLAAARLLTPAQERELEDLEATSDHIAQRILTIVHPDA